MGGRVIDMDPAIRSTTPAQGFKLRPLVPKHIPVSDLKRIRGANPYDLDPARVAAFREALVRKDNERCEPAGELQRWMDAGARLVN